MGRVIQIGLDIVVKEADDNLEKKIVNYVENIMKCPVIGSDTRDITEGYEQRDIENHLGREDL